MKKLLLIVLVLVSISCEKELVDLEALGENEAIIGTWIEDGYKEDMTLFKRGDQLDSSKYGFTIEDNGSFTERKNSGWCGTPPIAYANYEGSWLALSDSLIEITVAYWGGTMNYQMRIVSLGPEELQIKYLYTNDWEDAR